MISQTSLKPTCGNCSFVYHLAGDPLEMERCKLIGKFNTIKVNPLARAYCERTDKVDLCEYHTATESLKNRVDYSI